MNSLKKITILLPGAALGLLVAACSDPGASGGDNVERAVEPETASTPASEDRPQSSRTREDGLEAGTLTMTYGGETTTVETFDDMGTNLLFTGSTVNLTLYGPDREKFTLSLRMNGDAPPVGEYAPISPEALAEGTPVATLAIMGFFDADPGLTLKTGTVTVTSCDEEGRFTAEFSGEAASLNPTVEGTAPFSGSVDVTVPVSTY